ncbi:MAG: DUF4276 family protein [Saprospiraceae bacterium]|nr:DUF4276 family protein [Saprospiraceae bacterium]
MTKRHLEILTEEPSAEAALRLLLPQIVGNRATWKIITHQGKYDLLKQLPFRLNAYKKSLADNERIIILVDRDKDDCLQLKQQMETAAARAGLTTKSVAQATTFHLVNRIAVEEIESWFLGDEAAICTSYPALRAFPGPLQKRMPDNIANSWETLEKTLKNAGYRSIGGKIEVAKKIARNMNPKANRSKSFRVFVEGITACIS